MFLVAALISSIGENTHRPQVFDYFLSAERKRYWTSGVQWLLVVLVIKHFQGRHKQHGGGLPVLMWW